MSAGGERAERAPAPRRRTFAPAELERIARERRDREERERRAEGERLDQERREHALESFESRAACTEVRLDEAADIFGIDHETALRWTSMGLVSTGRFPEPNPRPIAERIARCRRHELPAPRGALRRGTEEGPPVRPRPRACERWVTVGNWLAWLKARGLR